MRSIGLGFSLFVSVASALEFFHPMDARSYSDPTRVGGFLYTLYLSRKIQLRKLEESVGCAKIEEKLCIYVKAHPVS